MKNVLNMVVITLVFTLAFSACGGGPVEEVDGAVWVLSDGQIEADQKSDPSDGTQAANGWSTANRTQENPHRGVWDMGTDGQIVYEAVPDGSTWSIDPIYTPARDAAKWGGQTVVMGERTMLPIPPQFQSGHLAFDIMISKAFPQNLRLQAEIIGQPDDANESNNHKGYAFNKWHLRNIGSLPNPDEWHTVRASLLDKSWPPSPAALTHIYRFSLYILDIAEADKEGMTVSIRNLRLIEVIEN